MPPPDTLRTLAVLLAATILEVGGDAVVRIALHDHKGATPARVALFAAGTALVTGYSTLLNLAPLEFGQVVGLYIATLFVVWQIVTWLVFGTTPTLPILAGGTLIVAGGALVSFWRAA